MDTSEVRMSESTGVYCFSDVEVNDDSYLRILALLERLKERNILERDPMLSKIPESATSRSKALTELEKKVEDYEDLNVKIILEHCDQQVNN